MRVLVANGPNLNLLGTRQPEIYGTTTLTELDEAVVRWGRSMGLEVETMQSNHEGDLIDAIQRSDVDGIVLNAAAYTHTSRAIAEAIASVPTPVVEVHISDTSAREPWRAESLIAEHCVRTIYGRGIAGYRDAMRHLLNRAAVPFETVSYGPGPDQVGDLRLGGEVTVVLVHGGFWLGHWTRDTMDSLAVDLARRGATTWNIEYRRLGGGGGWTSSPEDVLAALDRVGEIGQGSGRLAVVGHSAGAHMAIWAASRSVNRPDQVVALAPVVDLGSLAASGAPVAGIARNLLDGGAPEVVGTGGVPTLLIHGEADTEVPIAHSRLLAESEGLELLTTPDGHFELLDPGREHWISVSRSLLGGGLKAGR